MCESTGSSSLDPVSGTVAQRVAESIDEETLELSPPLYDVIDTDALNALFRSACGDGVVVSFEYQGCSVTVDGGHVVVDPPEDEPGSTRDEERDGPPAWE